MIAAYHFGMRTDLFPLLGAVLAAVCCGVLGNFLVLRRISLMGDAISHAVLPGLVIAFLIASTRSPVVMLIGAAIAGVATVVLVELVRRVGRVEPGAAMGVVFSVLFALGVLLIEQAAARHIDLDADCVLYGQLEQEFAWFEGEPIPRQLIVLAVMTLASLGFVALLFKELRIAAFDPALATAQGFGAQGLHYLLMVFVAAATVASFEAVGSILVIAMLICPAATARLVTDRLVTQIWASVAFAAGAAVLGYFAATLVPALMGIDALSVAGMISVASGVLLAVAIVLSPSHGLIGKWIRRRRLAVRVAVEDLLGTVYRRNEEGVAPVPVGAVRAQLPGRPVTAAIAAAVRKGLLSSEGAGLGLTERGSRLAAAQVRRHRLWESYLVREAGFDPEHVHDAAEQLEHAGSSPPSESATDPHGRSIPLADEPGKA